MPRSPTGRIVRITAGFAAMALLAFLGWSVIPFVLLLGGARDLGAQAAPLLPLYSLVPIPLALVFFAVGARARPLGWIVHLAGVVAIPLIQMLALAWARSGMAPASHPALIDLPGVGVLVATMSLYLLAVGVFWSRRRGAPQGQDHKSGSYPRFP
jgi:hypothetical protein